jgi:hypothetical protein
VYISLTHRYIFIFPLVMHRIATRREQLRTRRSTLVQAKAQLADDTSHQSEVAEEVTNERFATNLLPVLSFSPLQSSGLDYQFFKRIFCLLAPPLSPIYLSFSLSKFFLRLIYSSLFSPCLFPYLSLPRILLPRCLSQIIKRSLKMLSLLRWAMRHK